MLIPENMEQLSLRHLVDYQCNASIKNDYGDYLRRVSVPTFVCPGSLYTGNELEKCLITLYLIVFIYRIGKHRCCHCYKPHVYTAMGS